MALRFRKLQSRILFFFLCLFAVVQLVTLLAVTTANWRSVNRQVEQDLLITGRVFHQFIEDRISQLVLSAKLLSGDFAFKQAFSGGDRETLLSAVRNLQQHRIGADVMMLVDPEEYAVFIDTLHPGAEDRPFLFPDLIESSEESGEPSSSLQPIDGKLYRLVVVPLLAPEPVAWIVVGFLIDDAFAENLKSLTLTDVSFLTKQSDDRWSYVASSLPAAHRQSPRETTAGAESGSGQSISFSVGDERYVALSIAFDEDLRAVLQRNLNTVLEPFQRLRRILVLLALSGLALSVIGGVLIARTVTRPVQTLVQSTRRIAAGDYQHQIALGQRDEIGQLAEAFNQMTRALAAFQRYLPIDLVRTLFSKGIESKSTYREATILFVDIEDFTAIAESMAPQRVVDVLNEYFSAVCGPIERRGGVITQFQGDAILAVFNVPTDDPRHAASAVSAALEIREVVEASTFCGDVKLTNRIGINSGFVVAGTVGSENRVNYTVHGDAVNLAARLEVLNKDYGTRVLISQATAELLGGEFPLERIGEVALRGKQTAVIVYNVARQVDEVRVSRLS